MCRKEIGMNILALLFPGFTAIDYIGPANCWALTPGVKLQTAAYRAGPVRTDAGAELVATHSFETCWQEPDVLVIPGGGKPVFEALQDDRFLDIVARIGGRAGWVTSVCNGSLVLGAAGLLRDYDAACYWYSRDYLAAFGARPKNERIVIDRNRATGGGMTAGIDFALHMIGVWSGRDVGSLVELLMEYAPEPPFRSGRPELAPPPLLEAARKILAVDMPHELVDRTVARRGFDAAWRTSER
jgi:cyclohexyl-isocyanide hydratase